MIKTTTVRLPSETLIKIKTIAVETGTSQNNIINDLINKGLKATGKDKGKMKSRVINDEMPYYDPEKKLNFKDSIGIVEVDNAENIDVKELKDSIHYKKELY
jgi:predicted DNA-binding protein